MKTMFLSNMSQSRRKTSTFFPIRTGASGPFFLICIKQLNIYQTTLNNCSTIFFLIWYWKIHKQVNKELFKLQYMCLFTQKVWTMSLLCPSIRNIFYSFALLHQSKCYSDFKYGPRTPARDWGSCVFDLFEIEMEVDKLIC